MINSVSAPKRFEDLNSDSYMLNAQGVTGTAIAGTSTNIDLSLTDDHIFTGLELMASSTTFGDTVTFQVVDKTSMLIGIYGAGITSIYPAYPVLRQFGTNLNLPSDEQMKISKEGSYPAKVLAGLCIRCIYNSVGTTNVSVGINYEIHRVLV